MKSKGKNKDGDNNNWNRKVERLNVTMNMLCAGDVICISKWPTRSWRSVCWREARRAAALTTTRRRSQSDSRRSTISLNPFSDTDSGLYLSLLCLTSLHFTFRFFTLFFLFLLLQFLNRFLNDNNNYGVAGQYNQRNRCWLLFNRMIGESRRNHPRYIRRSTKDFRSTCAPLSIVNSCLRFGYDSD